MTRRTQKAQRPIISGHVTGSQKNDTKKRAVGKSLRVATVTKRGVAKSRASNPLGLRHGADRLVEIPAGLKPSSRVGGIRRKRETSGYVATLPSDAKPYIPVSLEQQFRLALPVLRAARANVKRGEPLVRALRQTGGIVDEYARRVCRAAIWNFDALAAAEINIGLGARVALFRAEVLRALDRAIRLSKGRAHGGGWRVTR